MKLKNNIYLLILTFSVVPVVFLGMFEILRNNKRTEEIYRDNMKFVSESNIVAIQNFCGARQDNVRMISNYDFVKQGIRESLADPDYPANSYIIDTILEFREYHQYFATVTIIDRDLRVVASTESHDREPVEELAERLTNSMDGSFFIGNLYERETDEGNKRLVAMTSGIFDDDELLGYIVGEIDADYFDTLITDEDIDEFGLYVMDANENLISAGSKKKAEWREAYLARTNFTDFLMEKWHAIDHEANPSGELAYKFDGEQFIMYYANVPNTDWCVRVFVNLTMHYENLQMFFFLMLEISVCFVLIVFIIQYFISKKILEPISLIKNTLVSIREKKDYSLRVPIASNDEINSISNEINELLKYVEQENIQEKIREDDLKKLAQLDSLTGIKNKRAIERTILHLVHKAEERKAQVTIGFLDIDNFRDYNTKYGHQVGDEAIKFVASTMQKTMEDAEVGRNGGDEFVFCSIHNIDAKSLERRLHKLSKELGKGIYVESLGERIPVPCSIGVVVDSGKYLNYAKLINIADKAMYNAKNKGKNTFDVIYYS